MLGERANALAGLDTDSQFVELKKILGTWRDFNGWFEKDPELTLFRNVELHNFLESLFSLFYLFKWPPWQKYNRNPELKDEFEKKLAERAKFVQHFFDGGGIEIALAVLKIARHEDLEAQLINLILWCAYSPNEQKTIIEKGALPALVPYINNPRMLLRRLSLTLMWGLFENFAIRELALSSTEFHLLDLMQKSLMDQTMRGTSKHCLGCLHMLTCGEESAKYFFLAQAGHWPTFLLDCYRVRFRESCLKRYLLLQCLANLLICIERNPEYRQYCPIEEETEILACLVDFMKTFTPYEIQMRESKTTSWQSMKPFVALLQSTNKTVFEFGAYTVAQLSFGLINRRLLERENLVSLVTCIQWSTLSEDAQVLGRTIMSNFEVYPCPSLAHILAFRLRQGNQITAEDFCDAFELATLFTVKFQ